MKNNKIIYPLIVILLIAAVLAFSGCSEQTSDVNLQSGSGLAESLDLNNYKDQWTYNETYKCYKLENIVYVEKPADEQKESMNIYVPVSYLNADGTINSDGTTNGYTTETAPILYINGVGGYAEANPSKISSKYSSYLENGYVVVSVGSRGKQTTDENGTFIGKSPAGLVDLKAGVRFLKANNANLVGSSDKIISIGTSAGGAMSSLLASTGNSEDYNVYLEEIGAIMDSSDNVFAAMVYCPITDLDHADMAYEWQFVSSVNENDVEDTEFAQAVSDELARLYPDYINSLELKDPKTGEVLILGEDGRSGTFPDYLVSVLEESATKYFTKLEAGELDVNYTVDDYINGNVESSNDSDSQAEMVIPEGINGTMPSGDFEHPGFGQMMKSSTNTASIDKSSWLSWDGSNATISSFQKLVDTYISRSKTCPAFDSFDKTQAENQVFGDANSDYVHFNSDVAPIIASLQPEYPDEYSQYYEAYAAVNDDEALATRKYLLNPMNYIGTDEKSDVAEHIRIRVGTQDSDTAFTISTALALKLQTYENTDVDYELVWDAGHGDADYDGELVEWIEEISK